MLTILYFLMIFRGVVPNGAARLEILLGIDAVSILVISLLR